MGPPEAEDQSAVDTASSQASPLRRASGDWSWQDALDPAPPVRPPLTRARYARALVLAFLVYMAVGIAISTATGSNLGGLAGMVVGAWVGCRLQGLTGARDLVAVASGLLVVEVLVAVVLVAGAGGGRT